ncbi:MAG TPA: NAD(P)-dependent oxidoreductase [Candidatus Acidoferrales bacterium]|nr:NAD(P)-dependent oxidoreductase [Candidatus Acidoferrales bacterium]
MPENIGFIGLGGMGEPMAANLLAAGHKLKVYNRTASKAAPLKNKGATVVASAADVATPGGIVFTMLADDRALDEVCSAQPSFVEKLGKGGLHVSLSTIAPATSKRLAQEHRKFGVDYVAAPVFGRPEAAAAARLWICASGPAVARERIRPLLASMGQRTFDFGEEVGAASVVKLCGNFMIAAALEGMAEAFALAEKNGVDPAAVAEMLGATLFACPIYQNYSKLINAGKFEDAKFRLVLGLKDVNLALDTAEASAMPLPLGSLLRDRLLASIAKGRSDWDWTAIALDVAENAGLRKAAAR